MKQLTALLLSLAVTASVPAAPAFAADNPLSVHILDLQNGQPTAGVTVTLEQKAGTDWRRLASAVTNGQGRIPAMYPAGRELEAGVYRVVFKTGEHYARLGQATFFPEIPVQFEVTRANEHYHIPLLLSPFGFSTYRGN